jgi:hypothetical protein
MAISSAKYFDISAYLWRTKRLVESGPRKPPYGANILSDMLEARQAACTGACRAGWGKEGR